MALDGHEEEFVLVDDGRCDCGGDKTDDDQQGPRNTRVGLRKGVGLENLVDEGRYAIEQSDVDDIWDPDHVELGTC